MKYGGRASTRFRLMGGALHREKPVCELVFSEENQSTACFPKS